MSRANWQQFEEGQLSGESQIISGMTTLFH
jgi:hypothetical protein